jgi:CheY-like chemotaxis protein
MFRILLAEDNPGDVLLFREALRGRGFPFEIVVAEDGQKAMSLLADVSAPGGSSRPDLIVLDVNLPKHGGDEVLQRIRSEASFAGVPVVMLTSSASPVDRDKATNLGANLYLQKSSNLEELFEIGEIIEGLLKPAH